MPRYVEALHWRHYGSARALALAIGNKAICLGPWTLYPDRAERFNVLANATKQQARILYLVARSRPEPLSATIIGERLFWHSKDPRVYVATQVRQMRVRMGKDCPIKTAPHYRGYYWAG